MLNLPGTIMDALNPFAPCFYGATTWEKAKTLWVGAILTPGKRTVSEVLRVMGLGDSQQYAQYHQVLNRAAWSPLDMGRVMVDQLVKEMIPAEEPLVFGIDETIERRWGQKIKARGIYRDAVRSSKSHFVKASGLRWVSLMLQTPIAWTERTWALPIMTLLAPSERYYQERGRKAQTVLDRSLQMLKLLRHRLPDRKLIVAGDSSYAALDFLRDVQGLDITFVTRLRLDANLFEPPPPYSGHGRPRKKGAALPKLSSLLKNPDTVWESVTVPWYDGQTRPMEIVSGTGLWYHPVKAALSLRRLLIRDPADEYDAIALLSTDPNQSPIDIIATFVSRWRLEVTFEECHRHLGMETQRQWSDKAIARTTPYDPRSVFLDHLGSPPPVHCSHCHLLAGSTLVSQAITHLLGCTSDRSSLSLGCLSDFLDIPGSI
jgi:hypothetical protein